MSNNQQVSSVEEQRIGKYKNFSEKKASEQMRIVRGYAIISKGDTPKEVAKETYVVPSQSGNSEYTITKNGKWKCSCPDFENRKMDCKHIHAVKFFLSVQQKIKDENLEVEEVSKIPKIVGFVIPAIPNGPRV